MKIRGCCAQSHCVFPSLLIFCLSGCAQTIYILVWGLMGPWQKAPGMIRWGKRQLRDQRFRESISGIPGAQNWIFPPQWPEWEAKLSPSNAGRAQSCRPSVYAYLLPSPCISDSSSSTSLFHIFCPSFFLCHLCPLMSFPLRISFFLCSRIERKASYQTALAEW